MAPSIASHFRMPESALETAHSLLVEGTANGPHSEDPSDPATVQAMQIVLHIPKNNPPRRTDVLSAAARAVVKLCLDDRVASDAHFRCALEKWYGYLIRKMVRRARNSAWERVQELPGVTVTEAGAQVRAFVPSAVSDVPPEIAKLQISGTELPHDDPSMIDRRPVIYVDASLEMSLGKAAAQVGHASMLLAAAQPLAWVAHWADSDFEVHVREVDAETFRSAASTRGAVVVQDAGFTEVAPNSITTIALP